MNADLNEDAAEALKGAVIAEYEKAIERGIPPANALSVLLSFAAEESGRLHFPVSEDNASHNSAHRQRFAEVA